MSCSWYEAFGIDNPNLKICGWPCEYNAPLIRMIASKKAATFNVPVISLQGSNFNENFALV
jgi:hypothetical protein